LTVANVLMLTCDQPTLTIAALESYDRAGWPAPVILLDNGGGDDAIAVGDAFGSSDRELNIVRADRNLGVAGGRNFLAAIASSEWLIFVDNDVVFASELGDLVDELRVTEADLVFPIILAPDGRVSAAGGRYRRILSWSSNGHHGCPVATAQLSRTDATDWGGGACLIVRRGAFDALGGFDERHGLYGAEDLDLCLRAREAGFRATRSLLAPITHLDCGAAADPEERRRRLANAASLVRRRHGVMLARPMAYAWYLIRTSPRVRRARDAAMHYLDRPGRARAPLARGRTGR
jgi:GT2 family glycosyltransferase